MQHTELIRRLSQPIAPIATDVAPRLAPIDGIRAVLFDVYGTLLVSASGDISLASGGDGSDAVGEALAAMGIELTASGDQAVEALHRVIRRHHAESDFEFPEVEIRDVWRDTLDELRRAGWIASPESEVDIDRLAIEYEMRANPVWPMPGLRECVDAIRLAGLRLGIVSNAQFFTPALFPALVDRSLQELGFDDDLCCWSYEERRAKPGAHLYVQAAAALAEQGVAPKETLYVGNDMRNDVAPAATVGFRTALFAGDSRSLRLRPGDALVGGTAADCVVTELPQILDVLRLADR